MEQEQIIELNSNLKYIWNVWYHHEKDNWKISGYKKIYQIKTIGDFWTFYNNLDKVGGITSKHFFLIKNNITPIWEDIQNINGGCWSFKIHEEIVEELWEDLSVLLVTNELVQGTISLGISLTLKKNNTCVVKIWNDDSNKNSIKYINKNILKKWGTDIIYIAHMAENNTINA